MKGGEKGPGLFSILNYEFAFFLQSKLGGTIMKLEDLAQTQIRY
jgi:hypothetical protein